MTAPDIPRLLAQEIAYTAARAGVIGRHPGNPFGVAMRPFGTAWACQVKGVPSPWLNRAIGLSEADAGEIPALAAWFAAAGIAARYETTPDCAGPALVRALAAIGTLPLSGDALVGGPGRGGACPAGIAVAASAAQVETFLDTHLDGLELPAAIRPLAKANMRGWRGQPGWRLLLADVDGTPAGASVMFGAPGLTYVADMATRPALRGRGVQTRLLAAVHALHGNGGVVWARCRFGSQSHRNLARAGLATLCTTQFWQ
jgi:GNAT superfamily N-acetyltransferase